MPQPDETCRNTLFDWDDNVDEDDVSIFLKCMSGPRMTVDPDCWKP